MLTLVINYWFLPERHIPSPNEYLSVRENYVNTVFLRVATPFARFLIHLWHFRFGTKFMAPTLDNTENGLIMHYFWNKHTFPWQTYKLCPCECNGLEESRCSIFQTWQCSRKNKNWCQKRYRNAVFSKVMTVKRINGLEICFSHFLENYRTVFRCEILRALCIIYVYTYIHAHRHK